MLYRPELTAHRWEATRFLFYASLRPEPGYTVPEIVPILHKPATNWSTNPRPRAHQPLRETQNARRGSSAASGGKSRSMELSGEAARDSVCSSTMATF